MSVNWQLWWNALGILLASLLGLGALTGLAAMLDQRLGLKGWLAMTVAGMAAIALVGVVAGAISF